MAIIYTYPLKYKPVAADLVVITDSEDRNFTKQCSVQSIIDLFDCDKCSFCTTSISRINTPAGGPIEALDCESEINFTSSDGSVTITGDAISNTIDLKAVVSGNSCPITYQVAPVFCNEENECVPMWQIGYGLTCDPAFEPFATSGDYFNMSNDGIPITHVGDDIETGGTCWATKVWNPILTPVTCEDCCCEYPCTYEYTLCPCESGYPDTFPPIIYLEPCGMDWELQDVVYVKTGDLGYSWCYQKGELVCEEKDSYTVQREVPVSCTDPSLCPCDDPGDPTYTWEKCEDETQVTVASDAGAPGVGETVEYCCPDGKVSTHECWKYLGDLGLPLSGVLPACPVSPSFPDCKCCENKCVYEYTACSGDRPKGLPSTINFDRGRSPANCECLDPYVNPVFNIGGSEWCYFLEGETCEDPTPEVLFITEAPCGDIDYCPATTYTFQPCDGGDLVVLDEEPAYTIGTILKYCCAVDDVTTIYCYEYMGPGTLPLEGALPEECDLLNMGDETDCSCCENYCHYEYTLCPGDAPKGMPPTIVIDLKYLYPECQCNEAPSNLGVEIDATGERWCYEANDSTCEDRTLGISYTSIGECVDDDYCPEPGSYKYQFCGDDTDYYTTEADDPWIGTIGVFPFIGYLQPDDCEDDVCCITLNPYDSVPPLITPIVDTCTVTALTTTVDCDCCVNRNVAKYSPCAEGGTRCTEQPDYYLDTCNEFGLLISDPGVPTYIRFNTAPDEYCCYERVDNVDCLPEEAFPPYDTGYIDCNCGAVTYRWKTCEEDSWTYTNTQDLSDYAGGVVADNGDCYQVEITPLLLAPVGDMPLPADDFVFDDCECCVNKRIKYLLCEDQNEECGTAGVTYVVISDTFGGIGLAPSNIMVGDLECCYQKDEYTCEPVDTVTYTQHDTCECITPFRYRQCGDDDWNYTDTDLSPWIGVAYSNDDRCYEIEVAIAGGPLWAGAADLQEVYEDGCDCCLYRCMVQYAKCDGATLDGCDAMPDTLIYNTNCDGGVTWPWNAPEFAIFSDGDANSCCYERLPEPPCEDATVGITLISPVETDCDDPVCTPDPGVEKWLYESCTGCETLVSTSQFHTDGQTAFWYDCCWYEVPAGPVVSIAIDNVPDVDDVFQYPIPCDVVSINTNLLFQNCLDDTIEIIWDCSCTIEEPYAIGTTITGLTGTDNAGNPISITDCWEVIQPTNLPISDIVCEEPVVVKCGEDPCLPPALSVNYQIDGYNVSGGGWNGQLAYWGIDWVAGGNLPIVSAVGTPAPLLWPGYATGGGADLYGATTPPTFPDLGILQGDLPSGFSTTSQVGYIVNAPGVGPPTDIGTCALTTNGPWTSAVNTAQAADGTGSPLPMEVYVNGVSVYTDPSLPPVLIIAFTQLP